MGIKSYHIRMLVFHTHFALVAKFRETKQQARRLEFKGGKQAFVKLKKGSILLLGKSPVIPLPPLKWFSQT